MTELDERVAGPVYPDAQRQDLIEVLHGRRVADPYRWLEDAADPRTRRWSVEQDVLFETARAEWTDRGRWQELLEQSFAAEETGLPRPRGDSTFHLRRGPAGDHAVLHVSTPHQLQPDRPLVDPLDFDASGFATLDTFEPSPDGSAVAYQISYDGTEESAIHVTDVETGERIAGPIGRTRYSAVAWLPDSSGFYYTDTGGAPEVRLHRLGHEGPDEVAFSPANADTAASTGTGVVCRPTLSANGRWLTVSVRRGAGAGNELWIARHDNPADAPGTWRPVPVAAEATSVVRIAPASRSGGELAYLQTTDGAPRGRICVAAPGYLASRHWWELIPEDPAAVLEGFALADGPELERSVLIVLRTRHAVSELMRYDARTGVELGAIDLPACGTVTGICTAPEGAHELWFAYTDFTTRPAVYRHDLRTGVTTAVAGGQAEPGIHTKQVSYTSADGTSVRMFVVAPDAAPSRPRPAILSAYGGFGVSSAPAFTPTIPPWIRSGGVFAMACVRGGGEEGEGWHDAGRGDRKQHAIDDLHAAADWLVQHGYAEGGRVALTGASNGGMLTAAAVTQRPERYAAAVCIAPVLDMVRYERFGMGRAWTAEYGSAEHPEQLAWLLGYSPYHNVRPAIDYPAVLLAVFEGDTRVDPLHARKFAAALQWATLGTRPVLLRRESGVGHADRAVSRIIGLSADALAFIARQLDVTPSDPDGSGWPAADG
jgi:prolyl oligopeptidase